ncbi:helix-turn-helix domain-containing protein, partial [Nocardia sp. NPDC050378]|uniref:TetR/AcrR family transcriptional regulator n=1 Tax=Nocardia sp. NPDC050378 TaxID=3155400 RepID=UPI0033D36CBA
MPPKSPAARHRPQQERAQETHERLLQAAATLFGRHGIAQVPIRKIASQAGVSVGTLYRYFPDRQAIVAELNERLLADIEHSFADHAFTIKIPHGMSAEYAATLVSDILAVFADILEGRSGLVNSMLRTLQFPEAGLSEFGQRLRLLVKVVLIQAFGPSDDR